MCLFFKSQRPNSEGRTSFAKVTRALLYRPTVFKLASDVSGGELVKLDYMKSFRNAYGERMTEAQEYRLDRRLAIGSV